MALLLRLVTHLFLMTIFVLGVVGMQYGEDESHNPSLPSVVSSYHKDPLVYHKNHKNPPVYHKNHKNPPVYHKNHKNPPVYHKNPPVYHKNHKNPPVYHKNPPVYHKNHKNPPVYHKTATAYHLSTPEFMTPKITCSAGFTLHNMECRKFTKHPPKFYCPSGFEENDHNECVRKITVPPVNYCDDGYAQFNGKCSKITEERIQYDCPAPYRLSGRKCVESVVVNPGVTCHNSTMIGQLCDKQIQIDAMKSCPEKHSLDPKSLQCFQLETQTPYPVCPKESLPEDGVCVKFLKLTPVQDCPNGFKIMDSMCVKEDVVGISTGCEGDVILNQDLECVFKRTLPVELSCDDGMTMDPATGDCILRKKPKLVCTEGGMFNPATKQCENLEHVYQYNFCPEGYEKRDDKGCVKTVKEPLKISCPEGYRVDEGMCVKKMFVDSNLECPEGFSKMVENCVRKTYAKSILKCPEGYKLYLDRCIIHKSSVPDFYCPDGFQLNGGKCTKERNIYATASCPYEFDLKGNKCVRVLEVLGKRRCPNDYKLNPQSGFCENVNTVLPEIECPDQFQYGKENPGMCVRLEIRPVIHQCIGSFSYDASSKKCRRVTHSVIHRCSAGHSYDSSSKNCGQVQITPLRTSSSKHNLIEDKRFSSNKYNYKTHSFVKKPKMYKKIYKKFFPGSFDSSRYEV